MTQIVDTARVFIDGAFRPSDRTVPVIESGPSVALISAGKRAAGKRPAHKFAHSLKNF